jgi:SAM-dependent methyltransferase
MELSRGYTRIYKSPLPPLFQGGEYCNYREGFDRAASGYDGDYVANPLWVSLRERVWKRLDVYFKRGDRVLDVGCGTGTDALHLAGRGVRVAASDISPAMIGVVEEKVRRNSCGKLVEAIVMGTDSLKDYAMGNQRRFDGIVSNFGPLNCEPDLAALPEVFHRLLKPGGIVVASIMNRLCLWEIIYYLLRGDPKNALRRFSKDGVWTEVRSVKMKTFYYQPQEVMKLFSPYFEALRVSALSTFLPPLYLNRWLEKHRNIHRLLESLETSLGSRAPFNGWGDHFLVELAVKKP